MATIPASHFFPTVIGKRFRLFDPTDENTDVLGTVSQLVKFEPNKECHVKLHYDGTDTTREVDLFNLEHIQITWLDDEDQHLHPQPEFLYTELPKGCMKDMNIACYHPDDRSIIIFILGDMPHIVKRIVNAEEKRLMARYHKKVVHIACCGLTSGDGGGECGQRALLWTVNDVSCSCSLISEKGELVVRECSSLSGLKVGDILKKVNGKVVDNNSCFGDLVSDSSSLEFIRLQIQPVSLKMIENVWVAMGGGQVNKLSLNKLTWDHFRKDCHSRMRVYLAVQVNSNSVSIMIDDARADSEVKQKVKLDMYDSIQLLVQKVDRIVDIFNSAGALKNAPIIDSPQHPLLYEMLTILDFFCDWRQELLCHHIHGERCIYKQKFFGREIWEDLNIMLLGTSAYYRHYASLYPGINMVQRRLNQDVCEHHFAHVRSGCGSSSNPTSYQANTGTGISGELRSILNGNTGRNCSGSANAADFNSPLPKKKKRRYKRQKTKDIKT